MVHEREVELEIEPGQRVGGTLSMPPGARGVVLFAHGSGSSRFSPRNRQVARHLQQVGLATFLMDLLSAEEEEAERYTRHLRFDIPLLARRVIAAREWLEGFPELAGLGVGLFGSSTGAAAALVAAAARPQLVNAVVSRGGRPDLAGSALPRVRCPTLLLVGGADEEVLELNREALARMSAVARLEVIPGATHLFEEPGTLEEVARLAGEWFLQHLGPEAQAPLPF